MDAGEDGAAVHEHAGAIQACERHDAAGHVLVTAANGDDAIEAFAARNRFDGVRDDLARDERIAHAGRSHADAIGDGDGPEDDGLAAGGVGAGLGFDGELVDVHVTWGDHAPERGDADYRLLEIILGKADGPKHRTRAGAAWAVINDGRVFAGMVRGGAHAKFAAEDQSERARASAFGVLLSTIGRDQAQALTLMATNLQ